MDKVEKYLREDEDATMGYHKGWYWRNQQTKKKNIQFAMDVLNQEGMLTPEMEDHLKAKMMESVSLTEETLVGWKTLKKDSYEHELWQDGDNEPIFSKKKDGYDLTILYNKREHKYIPIHGGIKMSPVRTAKEAAKVLDNYVDNLPDEHKWKKA